MNNIDYPRLRHFTMLSNDDKESLRIIVGKEHFDLKELAGDRATFLNMKRYFDGRHSIQEISSETNILKEDIESIVESFSDMGIIREDKSESKSVILKEEFTSKVYDTCLMWQRQIGYHKLFNLLKSKSLRKEVLIGLLLETYHYVKSAPIHTGNALIHCKNDQWKTILLNYLVDEYNHADFYLDALVELGVSRDKVINAHPLIGTSSLINMLNDIGAKSTLGYLACTNLFEANKFDYENSKKVMHNIFELYELPIEAIKGPLTHLEMDIEMDHNSLLNEALEGITHMDKEEVNYAVNCVHDLKHAFDQFHDQIIEYYSDISNYIPRLKVDYFSL
ncbi:iron-containing redox enzyme family protein [Wocania ichthyoenteri]|uniref:iron-containing redox enzyme family protein n=1 Tax=Wocania ichthyoenteri TaxID=1230531 RepID=UPI00053D7D1F|nr:iron-containing redox enzyme family protein [Wocania ichthyoenteri]